jgi:hypothetical protein
MSKKGPICFRLPDDLHMAINQMAEAQGLTTSELVRDILYRLVYNDVPTVDEGFIAGRTLGLSVALKIGARVFMEMRDMTPTEAVEFVRDPRSGPR